MEDITATQKIIFVVGNSRSGTTMLGRILGRAINVFTFNELHFFEQMWLPTLPASEIEQETAVQYTAHLMAVQRDGYYTKPDLGKYQAEASELIAANPGTWTAPRAFAAFVKHEAGLHGKLFACDQTPRNIFYIQELLSFYPNAYIVHIIRDPRDVLLSQKNRWRRRTFSKKETFPIKESIRSWLNYHPVSISLLWRSGILAWEKTGKHPRAYCFRFEDLLEDPEKIIRKVCQHLEMEYSPEMLNVPQVGSSHGKDNPDRLGINKSIAGQWQRAIKAEAVDLKICQQVLKSTMTRYHYFPEKFAFNPFAYLGVLLLWPVKAVMALLANLDKSTNIIAFIRRRIG